VIPFKFHGDFWYRNPESHGYGLHSLCDPRFSRFDTIPGMTAHTHRQANRQTHDNGIYHASIASHGKKMPEAD